MSKIKTSEENIEQADQTEMAMTTQQTTAVAAPQAGSFDLGDDDSAGGRPDFTLHIAHNISEKEPDGTVKGSVWLARPTDVKWAVKLADPGKEFKFVPFAVSHSWREIVTFGTGQIPREFNTKNEALAAGLQTDWKQDGKINCRPCYKVWALVEKPEGCKDDDVFFFALGGKFYAPVQMFVDKRDSYVSFKAAVTSAATILSVKLGVPMNAVDLTRAILAAHTEMRTKQISATQQRPIPYLFYGVAKDASGVVEITSEEFAGDVRKFVKMQTSAAVAEDPAF